MTPPPPTAEPPTAAPASRLTREQVERRVGELAREMGWFHNMNLNGVWTAPGHFLGDYPASKFRGFAHALPADLRGKSVLDIGCNGGFYSIEMKRRGASRVVGCDADERYLRQARFAAEVSGFPDIEFRVLDVYDVARVAERFDLVIFMGVLYHLRHPLLALDLIHEHVVKPDGLLLFQSMQRGSRAVEDVKADYPFAETELFDRPGFPKLHFVEHRYAGDVTNWWVPNRACAEAMLRAAGFAIVEHPEDEVYLCRRFEHADDIGGPRAVYPSRGEANEK
jgi:tRNA (mo5U34)-methyltransferase